MISPLNLSQFEIIKKVGEGGFGKVYEIKNKTSGKIFAAKVALFSLKNESKDMIRNLSREVNIISKLNHPSIVQFIGYSPFNFKGEPHPVIVTEFLPNGSLNDILNLERRGLCDVGWNDTKKIINIYGIAFAMSYLHSNNIIHRDLKPDNILMDEYLLPKLTDFGLSKVKHTNEETITLQSTATIKGTPIYIAPEIWATCMYSKECDVYAFAFIVYEIMTLEVPYKDYDYFGLMTNVLNGIRPEIIGVPECYKNLIEKCWDQNPSNRPTFDQIVYELKNNDDYITDLIEEEDFRQYIEYIEKFITSFNSKNHISITEFIDHETKTFQKIVIDKKIISKLKKDDEEEDDDDDYEEDEESTTSNSEEKPKKEKNKKIDINIKKKELPFQIPPDDDPSVTRYRELLYGKLIKLPKEIIPQSLFTYASLTEYGNVFPKNYREANIFYKIACDMGHVDSMWHYAVLLERGQGTEKNTKEADKYFQMAIEKGSVDAMTTYGAFLISRKNSSDQKKGIYYYKMGADNGDIVAMHDLGVLFSDGIVVKKDQNKALYFHKMAAKKGYLKSMHKISLIYQIGDGIPVDLEKAFNYMKLAANTGDAESINSVGWMYENGTGISKNIKKAIKYYNMAIEKGNTNAMVNYGSILYNTKEEKKIKQALQLFEKAADLNNTKALTNLHAMYNQGLGVTLNKEKALEYLQKAVDLGDIIAMRLMGIKYKQGDGVPVDLTKGFEYYKMAADKGSTDDMFLVGLDLRDGSGVEKNTEEALKYFKRGADLNNVACMVAYADIYNSGNDVPRNEEEAIKYYSMAKDKNDKTAYERLGCILLNKDRNSKEGIDYLKKAASLGDIDAMSELAELYQDNDERPQEDFDQSLCYSMQAYSNGNTNAMNYIYNLVLKKKIQQDNIPLAIEFVKKAADLGDTTAMVVYVTYLTNNCEPTPEVLNDQVHYAKLAADNGNSQGMVCYAVLLQNGLGIEKNIPEAIHYYKMAADLGNPVGQFFYNQYNRVLSEDEANQIRNNFNQFTSQLTNMVKELGEVLKKHNINLKDFQNNPVNNSQNNPVNDSQNTPVNDSNLNDNNNNDDDSISSNLSIDSNDNLDRNITTYKNTNTNKNIVPQKNTSCAKKHSCCFSFTITFFVACCIALFVYLLYYFVFS